MPSVREPEEIPVGVDESRYGLVIAEQDGTGSASCLQRNEARPLTLLPTQAREASGFFS
ncbi:hypothetical protein NDU88_000832, partial [Pleurodeles waltl]